LTPSLPSIFTIGKRMTREIQLTQGFVALVVDEDYEWLKSYKWHVRGVYAVRFRSRTLGPRKSILMHRFIVGLEHGDPRQIDHMNHVGLDNRKGNLRVCSNSSNQYNQKARTTGTSHFKGVCWVTSKRKWKAQLMVSRKQWHLGYFSTAESAAQAYDAAAIRFYGEFACTNESLGLL